MKIIRALPTLRKRTFFAAFFISIIAILVSPAASQTDSAYNGPKERLQIYILLGGRNMCGRAPYTIKEGGPIPGCYLLNGEDRWETADSPLNRYSSVINRLDTQKLNPGSSFAKAMLKNNPSISLGLIVNAHDGMTLKTSSPIRQAPIKDWLKGTHNYNEVIRRFKAAQEAGVIKGVLWHHGESDSKTDNYIEKLKMLITDLRKDLGAPELPFIAGQINPKIRNATEINEHIALLPVQVPHTAFISDEGLGRRGGDFNTVGMTLLGKRYAEAMLKLQGKNSDTSPLNSLAKATESVPPTISVYDGPKKDLHVYLLIGQSNMAGRAPFIIDDGGVIERCFLLDRADRWEFAKLPLNRHSTIIARIDSSGMNPGYMFAKTLLAKNPSLRIGLISNAGGSTSIKQWLPNSSYYKEAMRRVKAAQKTGNCNLGAKSGGMTTATAAECKDLGGKYTG